MTTVRPYQQQAIDAVFQGWLTARRQLIVCATGLGKTVMFAKIAERVRPQGRVLVLAHREELIRQACDKIATWTTLSTAVEMGDERATDMYGSQADVVVASVQTLSRAKRLERYPKDAFTLVIVDEAHHAPADTYKRIVDYFDARLLGVTATPDRLDKKALAGTFDAAPFVYEIRDAIEDGWLVPIRQKLVRIENMDLSMARTVAGDFNEGDLEIAMLKDDVVHGVARAVAESSSNRKTLVFAASIAHANAIEIALGHHVDPDRVLMLSGKSSREDRRDGLARFAAGDVQYLVNCALFLEGFDQPDIGCVAVARPTKSRALYAQMIGRGTRTSPYKRDLLVLDFVGNAGRHALINCFDILGGDDPNIRAAAEDRCRKSEDGEDVLESLKAVQEEMAELYRRQALEAAQRAKSAQISYVDIDPFRTVFSILKVRPISGRMGGIEPTEEQLEALRFHKIDKDAKIQSLDRGQAAEILASIKRRRNSGFCTYKQARTLMRFGYDPDVSFEQAGALITAIADNGWRRP